MIAFGYGITFDVENLKFAAFDQDQTPESRRLLESFSGSRYFTERPPISSTAELEQRMRSGELAVAVEIPSGFGRDVANLRSPEVAFLVDGAMPFRGFGLLAVPVILVMMLLSGAMTPMESMPEFLQYLMKFISPTPHYVAFAQDVLYRGADASIVWPEILATTTIGSIYFGYALHRFRSVIFSG
jgi:hypothetical protein